MRVPNYKNKQTKKKYKQVCTGLGLPSTPLLTATHKLRVKRQNTYRKRG